MQVLSSLSSIPFYAPSAGFAPTNSADVSAIASAYQVVSSTATQLYAGTAYLTSVNEAPISAARAGNAANASMATSAYYDGTGRLISSLPDSATVSAIASSYAESAASGKLDASESSNYYPASNPSGFISSVDLSNYATTAYVDSSVSSKLDATASANFYPSDNPSGFISSVDLTPYQPTSSMTAYQAAGNYLSATESSNYYPTSNPSGFISSVDLSDYATTAYVDSSISGFAYESAVSGWTAKQDALTFGYDTADKISGINGSALAGEGGGLVTAIGTSESGITSINNSGLVDTAALHSSDYSSLYVQEPLYISASGDSSYIGISGTTQVNADWAETASSAPSYIENKPDLVDIVAGPGIHIDNPDGNTLRVSLSSNEEVVLWSDADGAFAATLNESLFNFEKIKVFQLTETTYSIQEFYTSDLTGNTFTIGATYQAVSNQIYCFSSKWSITNSGVNIESTGKGYGLVGTSGGITFYPSNVYNGKICRVVGVRRIANN